MDNNYNIAIVGATGVVGETILSILEERNFPAQKLLLLASERSAGKEYKFKGEKILVEPLKNGSFKNIDIAFFSAGSSISKKYAYDAVTSGCTVIDNSSAYRKDKNVPLVIPEINPEALKVHKGIISNPNCTTIITLMALYPIYFYTKIKKMIVSSYQAVSGAGKEGIKELEDQNRAVLNGTDPQIKYFAHQISGNIIPKIDNMTNSGYTGEEMKMVNETRKIFSDDSMKISATCARVPVLTAHSVAVTFETEKKVHIEKVKELISSAKGVRLLDDPKSEIYPMPLVSQGKDLCFAGRIREDLVFRNGVSLWVSGDQIRKGAALNAVQIAEKLIEK